jgi:Plavaka transposase
MSSFSCPFCPRTFSIRSAYSQHVARCIPSTNISHGERSLFNIEEVKDKSDISDLISETSDLYYTDNQSVIVSEGDQSISEGDQSMQISENDQSHLSNIISGSNEDIFEDILEDDQSHQSNINSEMDSNEDIFENILELETIESEANVYYPNEAYADLMTLVTKCKLSNSTGNAIIKFFNKHANLSTSPLPKSIEIGRKYMDNIDLPNLAFNKTYVMSYNNNDYYLHHRSLIKCIKSILLIPNISQNFTLSFENFEVDGERAYSEQNTGMWWEKTEKSLPSGSKLLSIMLYSDATNVDTLGKSNLHPIYLTIGNIKTWRRNKPDVKQLLGFFPILKSNEKKTEKFKIASREAFHKSLEIMLEPILTFKNGIELTLDSRSICFYPRISIIISDWPEAATYCLTYKSAMSNFPCHFCLVARDNLADIHLSMDEMKLRTHDNMSSFFKQSLEKSVSIENVYNYFWNLP